VCEEEDKHEGKKNKNILSSPHILSLLFFLTEEEEKKEM
jgi:hypothetical protein